MDALNRTFDFVTKEVAFRRLTEALMVNVGTPDAGVGDGKEKNGTEISGRMESRGF
jgi:hypothetical protein